MKLIYYIKFDNRQPFKIIAKDFLELMDLINIETQRHQMPFEWLIRDYK